MEVSGKRNDAAEEKTAEELETLCELCEADHVKTAANGVCRECEECMCSTCFRHHLKGKLCRHHVLVDTNQSLTPIQRSATNLEKCKRHANETIKYFCRKHKTVGCGDCMIPEHFDCKPVNINDLSKNFEQHEDFKNIMTKIEDLMSANSASDEKIQESKKENIRMREEALKTIQNFRSEVNKYLDKAEENIVKKVKEIERNNDKLLAKLEQDCKVLSSEITEVRQKLDTELYKGSALFIQSVECKPKIMDIERTCSKIQTENEITIFEFTPDNQLQGIITSIEKLGKLTRFKSSAQPETTTQIKQACMEEVTERKKPNESATGKAKKEKGRPAAGYMTVGSRVRSVDPSEYLLHYDQPGTVTAVHPDGRVDVKWDATSITERRYTVGESGELDHFCHPGTVTAVHPDGRVDVKWDVLGRTCTYTVGKGGENEYSWAISKLLFLEARKGNSASGCANLVSCGGNGIVRFWNSSHNTLMAEFTAHQHAGSIIMASDKNNQYLVTGDVDGVIKVWEIIEYATHSVDQLITELPPLRTQFQPHQDMINTLELCERNERLIIISASSDCSVSLWDVHGNRIGTFGQEEHWKIEPYNQMEEFEEMEEKEEEEEDIEMEIESDHESEWAPDPLAVENPNEYRVDTWQSTFLGKEYQETRRGKRQRQQPGTIPDLAYLHWERTGAPPSGPYSALDIPELNKIEQPTKPDPDKYFFERPSRVDKKLPKLPALADTLKTAYDEKSLFPAYIREFEAKMKNFHTQALSNTQPKHSQPKTRPSLQNIGLQLGAQMSSKSPKPQAAARQKGLAGLRLKPLGGVQSRRSSVTTES